MEEKLGRPAAQPASSLGSSRGEEAEEESWAPGVGSRGGVQSWGLREPGQGREFPENPLTSVKAPLGGRGEGGAGGCYQAPARPGAEEQFEPDGRPV